MIEIKMISKKANDRIKRETLFLSSKTSKALKKELQQIGRDLKKKTLSLIDEKPKHGRLYLKKDKIFHRASAPGEAPAVITGKLRASIKYQPIGNNRVEFGSYGVPYAEFLEYADLLNFRGQGSSKILPRPYLSAAYKSQEGRISTRIEKALKKVSGSIK